MTMSKVDEKDFLIYTILNDEHIAKIAGLLETTFAAK